MSLPTMQHLASKQHPALDVAERQSLDLGFEVHGTQCAWAQPAGTPLTIAIMCDVSCSTWWCNQNARHESHGRDHDPA